MPFFRIEKAFQAEIVFVKRKDYFLLENSLMNTFKSKSKQSRDTINWNLQIIYVGFSLSVKTEEIRSFWLYFRKTLSLTEQNFYFVQLINLSFRGQITDWFGLLRRIYDVLHYCAVFCSESIGMYHLLPVFPIGSYLQSTIQEQLDMRLWIWLGWVRSEVRRCMIFVFLN